MSENLGTLYFAFRAQVNQWKQDLAAMDRDVAQYRAKWEAPVRMGAMAGGGGAGGGTATVSTGSGAGGLNIGGTSNGDVTWRLADSVDRFQARTEGFGVRRRRSASPMLDDGVDPRIGDVAQEYIGAGRIRMALGEAREMSRRQGVLAQQQFLADSMMQREGATSLSSTSQRPSLWSTKIPIQSLVRGTVYGLVVDAVAGMAANESKYSQSVALAGNNQGALARAEIQRITGGLASVPLIGGILSNAASMLTNPIETQLTMAERQTSFQDNRRAAFAGRAAAMMSATLGPQSYASRLRALQANEVTTRADFEARSAIDRAAFEKQYAVSGNVYDYDRWGELTREGSYKRMAEAQAGYRERQNVFNQQQNSLRDAALAGNAAARQQLTIENDYAYSMTAADVSRKRFENAMRPIAGFAMAQNYGAMADIDKFRAESIGKSPSEMQRDRAMLSLSLENRMADAGAQFRGIQENLLYGRGQQYDPYFESPLAMTDRSPEPISDQIKILVELTKQLVDLQKGIPNYGGQ